MSSDLEVGKMILPNLNINQDVGFNFYESPQNISFQREACNNISNSNLSWTLNNPSPKTVLNKRIYKSFEVELEITGTAPAGYYLYDSQNICPRAFPVGSVTNTEVLKLNTFTSTLNVSDLISAMSRYGSSYEQLGHDFAYCPAQIDFLATAAQMKNCPNNPFNTVNDQIFSVMSRNSIPKNIIANPISDGVTPATATLRYNFIEPVYVSPASVDDSANSEKGFANLTGLQLNLSFGTDLKLMFLKDVAFGYNYTNISVRFISAELLLKWYSLPNHITPEPEIKYAYNTYDIYPTVIDGGASVLPGVDKTVISNSFKLQKVPKDILVFIRPSNHSKSIDQCDYFDPLKKASVSWQFDNQLSNMNGVQLFEMARKNGLKNVSFPLSMMGTPNNINVYSANTLKQYIGASCPLLLSVPDDLFLKDGVSVGASDSANFQITVTYDNFITAPLTLYVVAITPSIFTISENMANVNTQLIPMNNPDAVPYDEPTGDMLEGNGLYGGKFRLGKSMGHFFKNAYKVGKKAYGYAKKALPYAERAAEMALMSTNPSLAAVGLASQQALNRAYDAAEAAKKIKGGRLLTNAEKMAMVRSHRRYLR